MSSSHASAYLHDIHINIPNDPPPYNDVINMSHRPTVPLLEARADGTRFSSIFAGATSVQFEYAPSSIVSFLIRDSDGSLQAKGDINSQNVVVQSVNGTEMLKIIKRSVNRVNDVPVHSFGVVHRHAGLGMIKLAEGSSPRTSLQIIRGNGTPIIVNSLQIGDYAVFRNESSATPLCNIQMPGVANTTHFNIKILFHPQTGITEEEQLLCTAAAIAFKITMNQKVVKAAEGNQCLGCFGAIVCLGVFVLVIVLFASFLEKHGCETKKSKGYAGYVNKVC